MDRLNDTQLFRLEVYHIILILCLIYSSTKGQVSTTNYNSLELQNVKAMNKIAEKTEAIMKKFDDAFQRHDPSLLKDLIAPLCIMESIQGPDGIRYEGYDACLKFWSDLASDPNTHFDLEEVFVAGERATIRWRYYWGEGKDHSVRGVNLMRVENGRIVEALGYAKTVQTTGLDN